MTPDLRIIQYGLGPIGAAIVRLLAQKPHARFVGAIDRDPAKAGQDLGRLSGLDRELGLRIEADAALVLARPAEVVVHSTGSYLLDVRDQLVAALESGHNVVSSCEELAYPFRKHPELSRELDAIARRNGVTLLATGVNPGFVMDKLPLTLTTVCQSVEHVSVTRIVDAGRRRLPLQKKVGAGATREAFEADVASGRIKHHGLPESAAMIADLLGLSVDDITETIEPVMATSDVTTEFLTVHAGEVAGVRQICRATAAGVEKVFLELQMYVGATSPEDRIVLKGQPDLTCVIPGGTHGDLATVAAVVNAIPRVVDAPPGLLTMADLPARYAGRF